MNRKDTWTWVLFGLFFLAAIYLTFRGKEPATTGPPAKVNLSATAVASVNPVQYHTRRAYAYEADRSYDRAAEEYRKLLELKPDDRNLRIYLASVYYKMGKKEQAITEIKEFLKHDPYDWSQWENLGDIYLELADNDMALQAFEESLRVNPDNAFCSGKVGKLYYQKGEYRSAVRAFKKSLEIEPSAGEYHLELGLCYVAAGDTDGVEKQKGILRNLKREDLYSKLSEAMQNNKAVTPSP